MLKKAQTKAENRELLINFMQGDAESLPFLSNQFDMITARHLLWTLTEPEQAIIEWIRVLKPGGYLLADISQKDLEHNNHHYPAEIEEKLPLNKNVSLEVVLELLQQAGLKGVKSEKLSYNNKNNYPTYLISGQKLN